LATGKILIDGKTIGVTTADAEGKWNFDISRNMNEKGYKDKVESRDHFGRTYNVDTEINIDKFTQMHNVM
ncbi:hypothetical protein, partial [Salmonella enterica]|uniref:hypothetical protein n=1 Tax=Salmonella enterica TaxID=28901 RepID=UPI000628BEF2